MSGSDMDKENPMKYSPLKTLKKSSAPFILVIIVRSIIGAFEQKGIKVDEDTLWSLTFIIYSGIIGFFNWLKNRNKKDVGGTIKAI